MTAPPLGTTHSATRGRARTRLVALTATALLAAGASVAVTLDARAAAPPVPAGWSQNFLDDFNGGGLSGNWRIDQGTEGGITKATIKVRVGEPCRIASIASTFGSTRNAATS